MGYEFTVKVEVEKTAGKFASRDSIEAELQQALEDADPGNISPDDSEYDTIDWSVEPGTPAKAGAKAKSQDREWLETLWSQFRNAPTLETDEFLRRSFAALGRYLGK